MCVCMYVCRYEHQYAYVHVCVCVTVCKYVYMYSYIHTYIYTYMSLSNTILKHSISKFNFKIAHLYHKTILIVFKISVRLCFFLCIVAVEQYHSADDQENAKAPINFHYLSKRQAAQGSLERTNHTKFVIQIPIQSIFKTTMAIAVFLYKI